MKLSSSDFFEIMGTNEFMETNNEKILPSDTKRSIERAISHAIMNGERVDIRSGDNNQTYPHFKFQINRSGIDISIGVNIVRKRIREYKMKD